MVRLPAIAVSCLLLAPALASADVPIRVPGDLLGGRVPKAQTTAVAPTDPTDVDGDGVELDDPEFWSQVFPVGAIALQPPPDLALDCDEEQNPGSCGIWGEEAAELGPEIVPAATTGAAPLPESTVGVSLRLTPSFGTWMSGQTPRLRWTPEPGATRYNVQVYLGPRRVASVWTTGTSIRIPPKVLNQGRYYMWAVWAGKGSARAPQFDQTLGRSIFGIVLRPRIVFTSVRGGVVGEVRPHIPGGRIRLGGLPGGRSTTITLNPRSRFRLPIARRQAERLTAALRDQGSRPPRGLKAKTP
jgi:hypothetical protein